MSSCKGIFTPDKKKRGVTHQDIERILGKVLLYLDVEVLVLGAVEALEYRYHDDPKKRG